jgi:DNA-directed RNA polymerase subunit RPC12/RpoP
MTTLICPECNTEVQVDDLNDTTACPNCGFEVNKENAGGIE